MSHDLYPFGSLHSFSQWKEVQAAGAKHAHSSVEIVTNDKAHEVPFARLEKLGPYSDWAAMHQLAVTSTYEKPNGQWEKVCQQMNNLMFAAGKHCARQGCVVAMEMYTQLMQIDWLYRPEFLHDIGTSRRPRIKKMIYDRFRRTITVRNLSTLQQRPNPTLILGHVMTQAFAAANLRLKTSNIPMGSSAQDSNVRNCDYCYFRIQHGANNYYSEANHRTCRIGAQRARS